MQPAPDHPGPASASSLPARWRGCIAAVTCLAVVAFASARGAPAERRAERRAAASVRLFESLLGKQAEPDMIPAPKPPSADEIESLRLAALPTFKPAGPTRSATAAATARPPQRRAPQPTRLPTWRETVALAVSVDAADRKVAAEAAKPDYAPRPTTVTVGARPGARRTPPIVVTRLQATGRPAQRTPRFDRLRASISRTLATYQRRPLNTAEHTPWEVMHGFIAFGIPTQVRVGGPAGDLVNAIGWSNMGGRCRGQVMLAAAGDKLVALKGVGVQGHSAQYLAILAQCRVAANSPIVLNQRKFSVADLIEEEKRSCRPNTELTFALIGLAHYLPTDATWKSRDGRPWSLSRLVEEEIEQPIRGAPCGGTHRLFGLSYGCQRRLRATGELDGVYLRADKYVRDYQNFTLTKLQNRDGSFSTEWFKYPADRRDDVDRKIQTTGHILEWLVASLDQDQLYDPRVVAAAEFLSAALQKEPSRDWKLGPLGHALHALNIYQERAWGVVLPGGIAAFHGPMKAMGEPRMIAERPEDPAERPLRR
ncbi:MAG: hypothetical protein ACKON7_10815 [Planctomycetaceae bacterium]